MSYTPANEAWAIEGYRHDARGERYENARLNTGDYVPTIFSNDASNFRIRFTTDFQG